MPLPMTPGVEAERLGEVEPKGEAIRPDKNGRNLMEMIIRKGAKVAHVERR